MQNANIHCKNCKSNKNSQEFLVLFIQNKFFFKKNPKKVENVSRRLGKSKKLTCLKREREGRAERRLFFIVMPNPSSILILSLSQCPAYLMPSLCRAYLNDIGCSKRALKLLKTFLIEDGLQQQLLKKYRLREEIIAQKSSL